MKFSELMLQITDLSEKTFFFFMDGLKPWVKQKLKRHGVEELTKTMIVAESLLKLGTKKSERFESSKPKFKPKSNGEGEKDRLTRNDDGKNQTVQKAKLDKQWEKKNRLLKCFIYKGSHMVRDYLKRSMFLPSKKVMSKKKTQLKFNSILSLLKARRVINKRN
ncbi:hypothetical protein V6Z12_D12G118800 [Gossypium hirsutum]